MGLPGTFGRAGTLGQSGGRLAAYRAPGWSLGWDAGDGSSSAAGLFGLTDSQQN
jgi:hypothetical protein